MSQRITRVQFGEAQHQRACSAFDQFPRDLELREAVLVHAAFEPCVALAKQRENVIVGTLTGTSYLGRTYRRPWHELYDGEKPIVVGHQDYLRTGQPFVHRERVFGLDTSCCHGRALSGLLIPEFRLIQVQARRDYWQETRTRYAAMAKAGSSSQAAPSYRDRLEDRLRDIPPESTGYAQLAELLATFDRVAGLVYDRVHAEHMRVLAELRADGLFDDLPERDQARLYAAKVGRSPMARHLHEARRGRLTRDGITRALRGPEDLRELAATVGLAEEEVSV